MKKHRTWQDYIVAARLYSSVYQYVILYTWQYRPARLSEIDAVAAEVGLVRSGASQFAA